VFQNFWQFVDAPVTNVAGERIAEPSPYVADLFWSTNTEASVDGLAAFNLPVQFSSMPGYFFGGPRTAGPPINTLVQVRVWDATYGSNYYEARDNGAEYGYSNLLIVTPDLPPGPGAYLGGLQGFQLQRLPRLTNTVTSTNSIVFSWPTEQTTYALQENPDLSPTNWTTLTNRPTTVGQNQQVILPVPPASRMFYRLVSQ
jgi:hypothetical protein